MLNNTVVLVDQVRIHKFLENSKRKNSLNRSCNEEPDPGAKDQERLRKKVQLLMKKQKLQQVRRIVSRQDDLKSWGQDAQIKVADIMHILSPPPYISVCVSVHVQTYSAV